jgi:hypothetical protein
MEPASLLLAAALALCTPAAASDVPLSIDNAHVSQGVANGDHAERSGEQLRMSNSSVSHPVCCILP